jgi:hypothetical protein
VKGVFLIAGNKTVCLVACLVFAGCAEQGALNHQIAFELGRADRLHIGQSLDGAAAGFLGSDQQNRIAIPLEMAAPRGPKIDLSARNTDYVTVKDSSISIVHRSAMRLRVGTSLTGTVRAGLEQGRYSLQDGISVFRDPASVDVTSTFGSVEVGVRQRLIESPSVSASVSVNRGVDAVRNRIAIKSALLDVNAETKDTAPYTSVELLLSSPKVKVGRIEPAASLAVRNYDGVGYSVLFRMVVPVTKK